MSAILYKRQKQILKYLNSIRDFRIITNSQNIKQLSNYHKIDCKPLEEIIPNENIYKIGLNLIL